MLQFSLYVAHNSKPDGPAMVLPSNPGLEAASVAESASFSRCLQADNENYITRKYWKKNRLFSFDTQ
jgi:hypothetical protein